MVVYHTRKGFAEISMRWNFIWICRECAFICHTFCLILHPLSERDRKRVNTPKGICVSNTKAKFVNRNLHKIPSSSEQHRVVRDLSERKSERRRYCARHPILHDSQKRINFAFAHRLHQLRVPVCRLLSWSDPQLDAPATGLYCSIYMCQHAIASGR